MSNLLIKFYALCIVVILFCFSIEAFSTTMKCNPYSEAECSKKKRKKLADEMAQGFVTILKKENHSWYECGEKTPKDKWLSRATRMARALVEALHEAKVNINPWGVWGTIYNESEGNRCAVGPNPRKVAYARRLIKSKNWRLWTEEDVLNVVNNKRWGKRPADLGLGQVVWRRYSRIEEKGITRIPTAKEMLSIETGVRVVAHAMKSRMTWKWSKSWRKMPWLFWPGTKPSIKYGRNVAFAVKRMGGPYKKILGHK